MEQRATYPPPEHVLSELEIISEQLAEGASMAFAPLTQHITDASGGVQLGVIVLLVDITGAMVSFPAAAPHWIATNTLSVHMAAPVTEGPVMARSRLLRRGSKVISIEVDVFDGRGSEDPETAAHLGSGVMTFSRIPREASQVTEGEQRGATPGTRTAIGGGRSKLGHPVLERIGLRVVDANAGAVELPMSDYVRNSFGSINGGVMGMVVQAGSEAALPGFRATDVLLHYLAQTKVGPARTTTRLGRLATDHAVCHVRVVDAGADDMVLAVATVTLQR